MQIKLLTYGHDRSKSNGPRHHQPGRPAKTLRYAPLDLSIYPADSFQQETLLNISRAANRSIKAYLIRPPEKRRHPRVPLSKSEDEVLETLCHQGATKIERFYRISGVFKEPMGTVFITVDRPLPASDHRYPKLHSLNILP